MVRVCKDALMCAGKKHSPETLHSDQRSDLGESLPGSLDPDKVHNTALLPLPASCFFIYPLKADESRLHDQAEWILPSLPLPRQSVYGLLCQQVTSSRCWFALERSNDRGKCTDGDGLGTALAHIPFLIQVFEDAARLKGRKGEYVFFSTYMNSIHLIYLRSLYHLRAK